MSIQLACPHCGRRVRIEDRSKDASASCPECGKPFTVPSLTGGPREEPAPSREPPARGARRPRRIRGRRARLKTLLFGELASIFVAVPLAFIALSFFRAGDRPAPVPKETSGVDVAKESERPKATSPEALSERVRQGSGRVARTYAQVRKATESDQAPPVILARVLQAVADPGVVVTHPSYEDDRLRAEFRRLHGRARPEHGRVDDLFYLQLAMRAETAIHKHFERRATVKETETAYVEEVSRFGAAAGVAPAEIGAELTPARREVLLYFIYRLALLHRTRAEVAAAGVPETAWSAASPGAPARAFLPAPPAVVWAPEVEDPEQPPGPDPEDPPHVEDPPPEVVDPPHVENPPLPAIGASTTVDELRRIVANRTEAELLGLPDALAGAGISGRASLVRYGGGDPSREFQDLTLRGSAAGDPWTIELVGKAAVPADDRMAARLPAGAQVDLAGLIIEASVETGKIVLTVRILRLTRAQ